MCFIRVSRVRPATDVPARTRTWNIGLGVPTSVLNYERVLHPRQFLLLLLSRLSVEI